MKVLIVEDEYAIRSFINLNLKREGFEVLEAESAEEALDLFADHHDISLAVLDVMLPGMDGFDLLKQLREQKPGMGIIMLTARTHEQDKIKGLEFGADDYISKPFSPQELIARINSLVRRVTMAIEKRERPTDDTSLVRGIFELNLEERKLYKEGEQIELTPKEYEMVELFMKNPSRSIRREEVLENIWGKNYFGDFKVVDVNIRRIRKKIEVNASEPKYLKTVWGYGYRWEDE